jgi:hypothetical protein
VQNSGETKDIALVLMLWLYTAESAFPAQTTEPKVRGSISLGRASKAPFKVQAGFVRSRAPADARVGMGWECERAAPPQDL